MTIIFGNNIGHTSVVNGVSCAGYWILILRYVYEKEGIPNDVPNAEFVMYQHPKTTEDNFVVFPSVARILNAMIRKVDPGNPVLVAYPKTFNRSEETTVLLHKGINGPSKC